MTRDRESANHVPRIRYLASAAFGRHEIPRWPFIPLAAPLVLLAYLKLRRVI